MIYIGTPSYDGKLDSHCVAGLLDLRHICTSHSIGFAMDVIPNNAFVGHGRNQIAHRFLKSGFRDLLFIDADIGFNALDAALICKSEPEVVFGLYPMKKEKRQFPGMIIDPVEMHPSDPRLIKMQYGATGFMRIRASVFEKMAEKWPDDWYIDGASEEKVFDFFPGGRHGNNFMSEDIAFCHRAREVGVDLWCMQGIPFKHTGPRTYQDKWQIMYQVPDEQPKEAVG